MRKIIVVGAGITGTSAAEHLRRRGCDVTLIDRILPGDPAQTSYGNAGVLARSSIMPVAVPGLLAKVPGMLLDPMSPLFLRWSYLPRLLPWLVPFLRNATRARVARIVGALDALTNDSVDQHLALAKGTGAEKFIQTGDYAHLYTSRAEYEADPLGKATRAAHGYAFTTHDRPAMLERDPHLGPDYNFCVNYTDHGWITAPGAYVAALAAHFTREGGTFRQASVVDIADGAVTLAGGEVLTAETIVLASGAWSKSLAARLGHRIALESERGYHLMLRAPSITAPFPYMVEGSKFVVTPMDAGLRLAGLLEFGGLKAPASKRPITLLQRGARRVYPGISWEAEESWLGHRPTTIDSLPMLGRVPGAPGVILAFGSQHIGLTIGPRLGHMVANIVTGGENLDLAPYAPDRFGKT